jgi:hypothetical protein
LSLIWVSWYVGLFQYHFVCIPIILITLLSKYEYLLYFLFAQTNCRCFQNYFAIEMNCNQTQNTGADKYIIWPCDHTHESKCVLSWSHPFVSDPRIDVASKRSSVRLLQFGTEFWIHGIIITSISEDIYCSLSKWKGKYRQKVRHTNYLFKYCFNQ